jgi:hypothetical protein
MSVQGVYLRSRPFSATPRSSPMIMCRPVQYRRDCMRGDGRTGSIPADEVDACRLTAVVLPGVHGSRLRGVQAGQAGRGRPQRAGAPPAASLVAASTPGPATGCERESGSRIHQGHEIVMRTTRRGSNW